MSSVFISYSRQDYEFVRRLIADLQAEGIQVWIDQQGLQVGTPSWERAIRDAIRATDAVVLIASPDSGQSRYVRGELVVAEMYKRPVYPVWAAGEMWAECVPLGLIEMQHTDARGSKYGKALLDLLTALRNVGSVDNDKQASESAPVDPNFIPRNPYKGLRAFTGNDTGDFFGRDGLVKELVEAVGAASKLSASRFLAIVGPSGSGKSSVVMAGLLPKLHSGALPGSKNWVYLDPVLPGSQPLESLAVILADALHMATVDVLKDLDASARGLHLLGRRLTKGRSDARVVLLVDQFEELFTQTMDTDKRDHFIDLLVTAAQERDGQLLIILTLRADFYDRPMNYAPLGKLLEKHTKSVLPMSIEDLRDVIEKPAALPDVKLEFEPGLVGDLLFEVRGQTGALPLLQFTLDQLAERRQGRKLTNAAYQDMGGVKGALAKHAEAVYQKLASDVHRKFACEMFLRLLELGLSEQEATRRRAAQTEFDTQDITQTNIRREVTNTFINERLLTTSNVSRVKTIEISHEALITEWHRMSKWLAERREDVRLRDSVSRDSKEWIKNGKSKDYLYHGEKLINSLTWLNRNLASKDEAEFLFESQRQAQNQEVLANREQIYQSVLSNTSNLSFIAFDNNLRHVFVHGQVLSLLGFDVHGILNKTPMECFSKKAATQLEVIYRRAIAGEKGEQEIIFDRQNKEKGIKTESPKRFRVSFSSIVTGQGDNVYGIVVFIEKTTTEVKNTQYGIKQQLNYSAVKELNSWHNLLSVPHKILPKPVAFPLIIRCLLAIGLILIGLVVTVGFEESFGKTPFLLVWISTALNFLMFGTVPGYISGTLGMVLIQYFVVNNQRFDFSNAEVLQGVAFIATFAFINQLIVRQRKAELAVVESYNDRLEQRIDILRIVTESMPVFVWVCDPKGYFTYCNRAWTDFTQRSIDQELGLGWLDRVHPDDVEKCKQAFKNIGKFHLEFRLKRADGVYRWILDEGVPLHEPASGQFIGYVGTCTDLTDRIEESGRLQSVLTNMPVMLSVYDENNNRIVWNKECERVTGFTAEEICGNPKQIELLYPDPEKRAYVVEYRKALWGDFRDWELETACKDGSIRYILWSNVSKLYPIPGWADWEIGLDVTERRLIEGALRQSESNFSIALKNSPIMISHVDTNLRYTWLYNPPASVNPGIMINKRDEEIWPYDNIKNLVAFKKEVLKTQKGARRDIEVKYGSDYIMYDVTAEPVFDDDGYINGLILAFVDITNRKIHERELELMVEKEREAREKAEKANRSEGKED